MNKVVSGTGVLVVGLALAVGCSTAPESAANETTTPQATTPQAAQSEGSAGAPSADSLPALNVTPVLEDLERPWDVVRAPDGTVLTGERSGRFVIRDAAGEQRELDADMDDLYATGETGLMGLALAPDFETSRTLYTCQGVVGDDGNNIGVFAWTVDDAWTSLTRTGAVVDDIPVAEGGRHGGCRILPDPADGSLYIGTGDTATPSVPQDRESLGGKVLHVNADGSPADGSPDRIFTLGHRNVQGLAFRPGTDQIFEVEQGSTRDDELNLLEPGGNYGWRPDREAGRYDESVDMTDPERVPGAIEAVWSSGETTIATPGLAFADGEAWGDWNRAAIVTSQQAQKLLFLQLSEDGTEVTAEAEALTGEYGRLRSVTSLGDGSFLLTTDNGSGDSVLLIEPAS